jgi:hypothetical protein
MRSQKKISAQLTTLIVMRPPENECLLLNIIGK